jgi:uncharacterized membrane protein YccC
MQHEIDLIDETFAASTVKMMHDHEGALDRIRNRLETVKKICRQVADAYAAEKAKELSQVRTELEYRSEANAASNAQMFAQVHQESERLSGEISDLSERASDAEFRLSEPREGPGDPKAVEQSQRKVQMANERTAKVFDGFHQMVVNALHAASRPVTPAQEVQQPPPSPAASRPSSASNNSTSRSTRSARGSRRESSRLTNTIEVTKTRKRPHVMISSQMLC